MMAFLESNPGLKSRFNKFIHFEDYGASEMAAILKYMFDKAQYHLTNEARSLIEPIMSRLCESRGENFGNARDVRNLLEHVQQEHADRLSSVAEPTREQLLTIETIDVERAAAAIHRQNTLPEAPEEKG